MKHLLITTIAAVLVVGCGGPPKDIWEAAKQGDIEAVKQHLAAGADVKAKGMMGLTPLHYATGRNYKEIAELLIAKGADVNAKDKNGYTPLFGAASRVHKEVAELLIAKGGDVNAKDDVGRTPLDYANTFNRTELRVRSETADLLRKHGGQTGDELKAEGK